MSREEPLLLDLFCGAGGAAMGYHRAGFKRIIGVDNKPQPNYPFEFVLADAMTFPLEGFELIHASPPCQAYSVLSAGRKERYPDLYAEVRCLLLAAGVPWVIENVIGAPYQTSIVLCGSMFGLNVRRHRHFESSSLLLGPPCNHAAFPSPILVSGKGGGNTLRHRKGVKSEWPQIMGMPWATPEECTQAIPPAYTEYIGRAANDAIYK